MNLHLKLHRKRGFSLVEVLVVIVIFAVGILAMVQIYPAGLAVLRTTKGNSVAYNLGRAVAAELKSNVDQLPEAILPSAYTWSAGQWITTVDLDRPPSNVTPPANSLDANGNLSDGTGVLGYWPNFTGANVARRVIGEGRRVPAPRFVPVASGTAYGGLMTLQFAPVLAPTANPVYQSTFVVYGGDLVRFFPETVPVGSQVRRDDVALVQEDGLMIALPQGPFRAASPSQERQYRISAAVRFDDAGNIVRRVFIGTVVTIPQAASGVRPVYVAVDPATYFTAPGLNFINVEPDTVRVQRVYDPVTTFLTEADVQSDEALRADAAYQYNLLDARLGVMLFNPIGSTYMERRGRGRFPLTARVDYDVLDWRNIRDDFRVPAIGPFQQKLILDSLKVKGTRNNDNLQYRGVEVDLPDGSGGIVQQDLVLFDRETGGFYAQNSYRVDKSLGVLTFVDVDGNTANGLSADIFYAGSTTSTRVDDIKGRSVRAIYQGMGDYSVQVLKANTVYFPTNSPTVGFAQCYVGGSNINVATDVNTRLYFPLSDIGKSVVVGESWYDNGTGVPKLLEEQQFRITAPKAGEWNAMAYVDIREKDPAAISFDFSRGYAVRRVTGASVQVRVFWNPAYFSLTADTADNMTRLGVWLSQMRRTDAETFLMPGGIE